MPAGHGLRSRTRDLFSRAFRKKGYIPLSTYLKTYRIGYFVDVKVNGAIHNGMPIKVTRSTFAWLCSPSGIIGCLFSLSSYKFLRYFYLLQKYCSSLINVF
ncbi:putative ribosomal protein L21e [Rosa chinensis]|uniref:Putative ribosomal protein L21e n=1 Tax=Rosa chinensis TaxID=74649 RepID=A0A2P6S1T4_ROSCH|nr:putative ribosomal protein L21e [Rosa chinensis]